MELEKDGFFNRIVKGICASEHGRTDLRVGRQRFLVCGPGSNPTEPRSRKSHLDPDRGRHAHKFSSPG
jgi:hypothetical protein